MRNPMTFSTNRTKFSFAAKRRIFLGSYRGQGEGGEEVLEISPNKIINAPLPPPQANLV